MYIVWIDRNGTLLVLTTIAGRHVSSWALCEATGSAFAGEKMGASERVVVSPTARRKVSHRKWSSCRGNSFFTQKKCVIIFLRKTSSLRRGLLEIRWRPPHMGKTVCVCPLSREGTILHQQKLFWQTVLEVLLPKMFLRENYLSRVCEGEAPRLQRTNIFH